jgi:ABC-type multidrug transport system fused ATPase/permease subunit
MLNDCFGEVDRKAGILFAIIVFTAISSGFRGRIFNTLSDEISMIMRGDMFEHIIFQDTGFYDKKENSTGQVIARMSTDVEVIQDLISTNVSMLLRGGLLIIATIAFMFYLNWQLSLVTMGATIPIIIMTLSYGHCFKARIKAITREKGRMTHVCQEAFTNIRTVKAFACEEEENKKFDKVSHCLY